MIVLHGLKNCDTCRKALKALSEAGFDAELRDLRQTPPTREEITAWLERLGPEVVNTRSTTWRGLSEAERAEEAVSLLLAQPALIKRPVIEADADLYLGWTPKTRLAFDL